MWTLASQDSRALWPKLARGALPASWSQVSLSRGFFYILSFRPSPIPAALTFCLETGPEGLHVGGRLPMGGPQGASAPGPPLLPPPTQGTQEP